MSVSIQQVAHAAGVSTATVSRALRGLEHVNAGTCQHVRRIAASMGYMRDPMLSVAFSRIRTRTAQYKETIGFLSVEASPEALQHSWRAKIWSEICHLSMLLGYQARPVTLPVGIDEQRRLIRQLQAQGIRGLVLGPRENNKENQLAAEWKQFYVVEINYTRGTFAFTRVQRELHDDMRFLLGQLELRQYTRIGLALDAFSEAKRQMGVLGPTLCHIRNHQQMKLCGVLYEDGFPYSCQGLIDWLRKYKPNVIIVSGDVCYNWLIQSGWKIPEALGICRIDVMDNRKESGLIVNYKSIAQMAVKQLVFQLEHECPSELVPKTVIGVPSSWVDGETLKSPLGQANRSAL